MARILFAWELGGELGHARRSLQVARELRELGHATAFAFADLLYLASGGAEGCEWFQAPALQPLKKPNPSPLNASEILLNRGFGDPAALAGALRAWTGLFGLWKPDLVVGDYAPGAMLAARLAGLRRAAIGTGFSMPPPAEPLPGLRPWMAMEAGPLRVADATLMRSVRAAVERVDPRAQAPQRAADLFTADTSLLCTWPEVDPFGPRQDAEYIGPQDRADEGARAQWASVARPRIFAYLKRGDPRFVAIVEAIRATAAEAIIAVPGRPAANASALSSGSLQVHGTALAVGPLMATADLCVCHSGPGIVARALEAGVPLALLPQQVEQFLVGRRIVSSGAGVMLSPEDFAGADLRRWLAEALSREELRVAAAASTVRGRTPASAAARIERALRG